MARLAALASMPTSSPSNFIGGRSGASRSVRGFTLLEIMLVLALVAVGTLMMAAAFSRGGASSQLRNEAAQMTNGLRDARARALRTQMTQRFVLDTATHAWQVPGSAPRHVPDDVGLTLSTAEELREGTSRGVILFFPDGASSGGRVDLSRNGATWRLDVHWLTGQVRNQRVGAQ